MHQVSVESEILRNFDISPERGFLGLEDPLVDIPKPFSDIFAPWISLGEKLPEHIQKGTYRDAVLLLPNFSSSLELVPLPVLWRLSVIVGFLVQAYIWEPYHKKGFSRTQLSSGLSIIFYKLCKKLQVTPAFNYMMYAGKNWRRIDPKLPITADNVTMLTHFNGEPERLRAEDWFVAIHIEIERRAGALLVAVLRAEEARKSGYAERLSDQLLIIERTLLSMRDTIERMNERCTPQVYYDHVRPYLSGFIRVEEGVIFERVKQLGGIPQRSLGQTGAQSSIAPLLDRFLSITHDQETESARRLSQHLDVMLRKHTPPPHRKFVLRFESESRFRVRTSTWKSWEEKNADVREALIAVRLALAEFRKAHFALAVTHIVQPARRVGDKKPIGTGGTDLSNSLPKHLEETLHPSHREEKMNEFREYFRSLHRSH